MLTLGKQSLHTTAECVNKLVHLSSGASVVELDQHCHIPSSIKTKESNVDDAGYSIVNSIMMVYALLQTTGPQHAKAYTLCLARPKD